MDRKKSLKEQYKKMKPEMGILVLRCEPTGKEYMAGTMDTRATINSVTFRLGFGSLLKHPLQLDWNQYGEENFTIEVIDTLQYDKDESKTDYKEDLALLLDMWKEKKPQAEVVLI